MQQPCVIGMYITRTIWSYFWLSTVSKWFNTWNINTWKATQKQCVFNLSILYAFIVFFLSPVSLWSFLPYHYIWNIFYSWTSKWSIITTQSLPCILTCIVPMQCTFNMQIASMTIRMPLGGLFMVLMKVMSWGVRVSRAARAELRIGMASARSASHSSLMAWASCAYVWKTWYLLT